MGIGLIGSQKAHGEDSPPHPSPPVQFSLKPIGCTPMPQYTLRPPNLAIDPHHHQNFTPALHQLFEQVIVASNFTHVQQLLNIHMFKTFSRQLNETLIT